MTCFGYVVSWNQYSNPSWTASLSHKVNINCASCKEYCILRYDTIRSLRSSLTLRGNTLFLFKGKTRHATIEKKAELAMHKGSGLDVDQETSPERTSRINRSITSAGPQNGHIYKSGKMGEVRRNVMRLTYGKFRWTWKIIRAVSSVVGDERRK
jgi:hypothetical protein